MYVVFYALCMLYTLFAFLLTNILLLSCNILPASKQHFSSLGRFKSFYVN